MNIFDRKHTLTDAQSKTLHALVTERFRFVAVDVETANPSRQSICQIGFAGVRDDGSILQYSCYVDPEEDFSPSNIFIHGITPETVTGSGTFSQHFQTILPILAENILIQHSPFDCSAFTAACQKYDLSPPPWNWLDSVRIARRAWPHLKGNGGHSLKYLKSFLSIDFNHHDAGEDARAAAMIVLHAEEHTNLTFQELAGFPHVSR
ncbi:MAG: 3'-5' exonuclease [Acetobacter sp.]|jgi:DNA polymerase-3 subunit epsilon|nr:3'-5' exonuclease [Acetobacter sp.]